MLTLVKDLDNFKIVFYWVSSQKKKVSPTFPTLVHAKEWYTEHMFSAYKGNERRKRVCDRRNPEHFQFDCRRMSPQGRRFTDKSVKVGIDLVSKKINEIQEVV